MFMGAIYDENRIDPEWLAAHNFKTNGRAVSAESARHLCSHGQDVRVADGSSVDRRHHIQSLDFAHRLERHNRKHSSPWLDGGPCRRLDYVATHFLSNQAPGIGSDATYGRGWPSLDVCPL